MSEPQTQVCGHGSRLISAAQAGVQPRCVPLGAAVRRERVVRPCSFEEDQ